MRTTRSRRCAGALLSVIAATLLVPLAALARTPLRSAERHGCHCPVKMACCEAGLCHSDEDRTPTRGPSWSGCRDEAPDRSALPGPSTALDSALLPTSASFDRQAGSTSVSVVPAPLDASTPAPSTPPPRLSTASR
jgi:hypothetical protein